jgi:hypothetical protein
LPNLEAALAKAIQDNVGCAPNTGKGGAINFVLEIDFNHQRLNVFPGASGQWRGPQSKRAAECVLRSLPPFTWQEIPHQYRYYAIAILATYPAATSSEQLPDFE